MRERRGNGFTVLEIVVVIVLAVLLVALLMPVRIHGHQRHEQTKCGNNLKQIALSAIQYADEACRPGSRPPASLGGSNAGYATTTAAKAVRTLVYLNYCDNPEVFCCPSSLDTPAAMSNAAKADPRKF